MNSPIQWNAIHTVLLDMDGTLLDLNYDNHFWKEHVPLRYAEKHQLTIEQAKTELMPRYQRVEGSMEWYCVDYWSAELGLDIAELKREIHHLIAIHEYTIEFLDFLRQHHKRVVLVTNAHQKSLALKMERTQLEHHFDQLICSHDFGYPKEHQTFWSKLHSVESYDPAHTLLIDDSLPILQAAQEYGIQHLVTILKPDSQAPEKTIGEFIAIRSFKEIMR